MSEKQQCSKCSGSGTYKHDTCSKCEGSGFVKKGIHEKSMNEDQRQALGGLGGAAAGFAGFGPIGALAGGIIGLAISSDEEDSGPSQ